MGPHEFDGISCLLISVKNGIILVTCGGYSANLPKAPLVAFVKYAGWVRLGVKEYAGVADTG